MYTIFFFISMMNVLALKGTAVYAEPRRDQGVARLGEPPTPTRDGLF